MPIGQDPLYPTRTHSLGRESAGLRAALAADSPEAEAAVPEAGRLFARVVGLDPDGGRPMSDAERDEKLKDPFARLLIARGRFPMTLDECLGALSELDGTESALSRQLVFAVSETGQIRWSPATSALPRSIRYVVARGRPDGSGADLLISTRPPSDSREAFLQVAAWDPEHLVFHFYERADDMWLWEGNSWHALSEPTRGRGPFDSHVNGALVMKELKLPWLHWESSEQGIPLESFPPDHPVRTDRMFGMRQSAHILEREIVRPAVRRWTRARLESVTKEERGIGDPTALLRHVLTSTTVNIFSSRSRSAGSDAELDLPLSFFFDSDLFVDRLGLEIQATRILVQRQHYQAALARLGVALRHGNSGFEQKGDSFFAWAVPERAFEDIEVVAGLMQKGILSKSFVLSLLMVDFPNPIDSPRRGSLMKYVPAGPLPKPEIEQRMREAIRQAASGRPATAPEVVAAHNLDLDPAQLETEAAAAINAFLDAVRARAAQPDGVLDFMRLADWRRRAFRRRTIAEFDLSLPFGDGPALDLLPDAAVAIRPADEGLSA